MSGTILRLTFSATVQYDIRRNICRSLGNGGDRIGGLVAGHPFAQLVDETVIAGRLVDDGRLLESRQDNSEFRTLRCNDRNQSTHVGIYIDQVQAPIACNSAALDNVAGDHVGTGVGRVRMDRQRQVLGTVAIGALRADQPRHRDERRGDLLTASPDGRRLF